MSLPPRGARKTDPIWSITTIRFKEVLRASFADSPSAAAQRSALIALTVLSIALPILNFFVWKPPSAVGSVSIGSVESRHQAV